MKVRFWGVRGSIATSGSQFAGYGGNTTCVEVSAGGKRLIIDAGTGVRALGQELLAESREKQAPIDATFLFTHLHWDHIQGFPFFGPAFLPSTTLTLHGPRDETGENTLEDVLASQMTPPNFPVPLAAMGSSKSFHTIASGDELEVDPFVVRTQALCHPQGSLGYRIEAGGRSLCFATDVEHREDGTIDESILELAHGVDLLIYDGQYTQDEYDGSPSTGPSRKGWGHSTYAAATDIARAAGARRLILFHHDPMHDDAMMDRIEADARGMFPWTIAAREGARLDV